MPTTPKRTIQPGTFVPNHNPDLKIVALSLEGDVEHWLMLPVTGFLIEGRIDPPPSYNFVTDWPISITSLEGIAWCLYDRDSGLCFSPADADWIGGLSLAEAKAELVASSRLTQGR